MPGMEPHFLSSERKLEPDGENRDLVFLLPRLPASQARRAIRAICLINYQTKNMRPPTSQHNINAIFEREIHMDIVWGYINVLKVGVYCQVILML